MQKIKFLVLMIVGLVAATASADVLVARHEQDGRTSVEGVSYEHNAKLGRAWAVIEYRYSNCTGGDDCDPTGSARAKVPGMSFDAQQGAVVYAEGNAAPVVCARLVKHWYGTKLEATRACGITRTAESVKVLDDGYETKEVKSLDVYFGLVPAKGRRGD